MIKDFIRKNILGFIVIVIFSIITNGGIAVSGILFIRGTDSLIANNFQAALIILAIYLAVEFTSYFFDYHMGVLFDKTIQSYNHYLRDKYILNLADKNSLDVDVNNHINALTNDLYLLSQKYLLGFLKMVNAVIKIAFSVFALLTFHWVLVLTALVASLGMLLIPRIFNKALTRATQSISDSNESLIATLSDWLSGLSELKFANSKSLIWRMVAPTSKKLGDAYVYESRVDGAVATFSNVVGTLAQIGITVVAGFLNFAGTVSIGVVVKVNSFIFPIFTGFMTLTNNISNHVSGQKLADKFLAISNAAEQLDLDKTSNNEQVIPAAPAISLNHLSYQFGNKTIAYPDVIIEAGSKVAIMGPSGSGKSTLVKILMNQLPNYQGSITLWGNEVSRIATTEIEDFIGYLPQESHVFNTSVVENVTLYDDALKPELNHVLEEVNMLKTITALPEQSETVVGSNGYPLSGGEKQRLSLARAFIRQKKLLIIDEGTSALDEQNAKEIVSSIMKNKDLTLLMITHTSDRELIKDFDQVLTVG